LNKKRIYGGVKNNGSTSKKKRGVWKVGESEMEIKRRKDEWILVEIVVLELMESWFIESPTL